ncbi:LPS export ABC transporter permease LptG [Acetobacter indonesiensis]|uniref:LPS export ABC transporter permease LptG n=1 Tax=Acetobacter indonesiensis TaxID=104101 RepID=UPI0020A5CE00|nr:LPS export ABC transporter permease LptG [Acetobacter indonesiensis]MCP1230495.1 LPS export ABC transporter permease LptG [Acetobacter indonesiensis]
MVVSVTLSLYIARQFVFSVLAMIASLTGIVCLFDFIDLLRRVATKPDVSTNVVTEIAALHVPYFGIEILPFGILLGGIVCFWRLTRSSELIVARAAGISAWQFLAGPLACAMLIGAVATGIISPVSSSMYRRAEELDQQYLRTGGGPLSLSSGSLWLRQSDTQYDPHGVAILHARGVQLGKDNVIRIKEISVFRLDHNDKLMLRIESPEGYLGNQNWVLEHAQTVRPYDLLRSVGQFNLPTDLTVGRVQESFSSPETLSIWALPSFIKLLDRSGFSSIRHRIHFQSLLALPMLAGTMALVAAGFSMRPTRRGGVAQMIGSGVAAGFLLFTISKVAEQFGNSGALPPVLAAWAPTVAGLCLAISLLLHLEDG